MTSEDVPVPKATQTLPAIDLPNPNLEQGVDEAIQTELADKIVAHQSTQTKTDKDRPQPKLVQDGKEKPVGDLNVPVPLAGDTASVPDDTTEDHNGPTLNRKRERPPKQAAAPPVRERRKIKAPVKLDPSDPSTYQGVTKGRKVRLSSSDLLLRVLDKLV